MLLHCAVGIVRRHPFPLLSRAWSTLGGSNRGRAGAKWVLCKLKCRMQKSMIGAWGWLQGSNCSVTGKVRPSDSTLWVFDHSAQRGRMVHMMNFVSLWGTEYYSVSPAGVLSNLKEPPSVSTSWGNSTNSLSESEASTAVPWKQPGRNFCFIFGFFTLWSLCGSV